MSDSPSSLQVPVGEYARVSTYKQIGGRFESCDAQLEVCREFIQRHSGEGWFTAASFVDLAYTGKNMDRPGMRAMKEAIAAGRIKVVVSYKLERMLRSTDEWPSFRRFLKEHGCQMVSVSEGVAEETASGRLKTNVLVSVAAYERENTAEKVRSKMHLQAKRGFWNGGLVPFGYTYDPKTKTLAPDPVEAPARSVLVRQGCGVGFADCSCGRAQRKVDADTGPQLFIHGMAPCAKWVGGGFAQIGCGC